MHPCERTSPILTWFVRLYDCPEAFLIRFVVHDSHTAVLIVETVTARNVSPAISLLLSEIGGSFSIELI